MSKITVSFTQDWIDSRRTEGVRVIRLLEKWIASEEWITLKSSSGNSLTVELQPASREDFLKGLADHLTTELGESKP